MPNFRMEKDFIGEMKIPENALWGIHTQRAIDNFNISKRKVPKVFIHAYGMVKLACTRANQKIGYLNESKGNSIQTACLEMTKGHLDDSIVVDPYQGGAGTSTHMNVNEVLANRALMVMGKKQGQYEHCDPITDVNMHQSTNDTFPTVLRISVYQLLNQLETEITKFQEEAQKKEREFSDIVKIGRTELMDAVPMTLGRTFGAWAEALARDRWRIFKCTERIRVINLGGTAIGTGLGAPRDYIFKVNEEIKGITGLPLARAENMVDATQNQDALLEVSGMLKTHAMNLMKISGDLRLLSMGPDAGVGELVLPARQAGSSIMPHKTNPVIPEMMAQVAMQVAGHDQAISWAVGSGQLEINAFLPLVSMNLIESLELMISTNRIAAKRCLADIEANEAKCLSNLSVSRALVTVLVPKIGYHQATKVARKMKTEGKTLEKAAHEVAGLPPEEVRELLTPQAVNALGFKTPEKKKKDADRSGENRS